jgi:hypothetical protein
MCTFPGLVVLVETLADGVIGPLNWSLLRVIKKRLLIATLFPVCRFVVAWLCTGVGAIGMLWLWWRWRKNYVWALNQIFMYVKVLGESAN